MPMSGTCGASHVTCRELIDFLMSYLEGDLAPNVRADFDLHLSECPECVAYVNSYRRAVELGRSALVVDAQERASDAPESLIRAILRARGEN